MVNEYGYTTVRNAQGQNIGYEKVDADNSLPYVPENEWMAQANAALSTNKQATVGDIERALGRTKSAYYTKDPTESLSTPPKVIDNPYANAITAPQITKKSMANLRNTNSIEGLDPTKYNIPSSRAGKQWAFGNQDFEGVYKPTVNGTMTLGAGTKAGGKEGVSVTGTLYQSNTGRWQVIDKQGHLAMSGSDSAPLPGISDMQGFANAISAPSSGGIVEPGGVKTNGSSIPVSSGSAQPSGGWKWFEDPEDPRGGYFAESRKPIATKKKQYADPGNSTVGAPFDNTTYQVGGSTLTLPFGAFGAKQKRRAKPTHRSAQKPAGFMDIFGDAKKTVKKPTQNSIKKGSGLSYENLLVSARKPTKPIKAPIKKPLQSPVKKPTTKNKEVGFGNAYEVLFSNKRRK